MTERLICPIDFSETSEYALSYAVSFASQVGGTVHLLHVYQAWPHGVPQGAPMVALETNTQAIRHAEDALRSLIERYDAAQKGKLEYSIVEGTPHEEINRFAEEKNGTMIVMGTHGRSGLAHWLLGSVTERVLRTAKIPVLTLRRANSNETV